MSLLILPLLLQLLGRQPLPATAAPPMTVAGCSDRCGDVMIPYPFGIEDGCYYSDGTHFRVTCDETTKKPLHGNFRLLGISVPNATLRVLTGVAVDCYSNATNTTDWRSTTTTKHLGRFHFSASRNKFTGVGCDTVAFLLDNTINASVGCLSTCSSADSVHEGVCNGGGCCQNSELPLGLRNVTMFVRSFNDHRGVKGFNPCSYAFLVDDQEFRFNKSYYLGESLSDQGAVPTVLDWAVGHGTNCSEARMNSSSYTCKDNSDCVEAVHGDGYLCACSPGFYGNPYLGCQDIDECSQPEQYPCNGTCYNTPGSWSCTPRIQITNSHKNGKHFVFMMVALGVGVVLVALAIQCCVAYTGVKRRWRNNQKRAFFKRNGGIRLQETLSQVEHAQTAFKIFTAEEMEAATDSFDRARIVGSGGFADVYKGHLSDGALVAIKKPKTKSLDKDSEDVQFINEVILLSKIQHHNVVTFLGCCLETEAPLLVYEFIANGTLLDHLHKNGLMSWETRLKIAAETAGVLAYLHCDHRPSIIHSDIKPHNILLGDDFTAKVSDFGISKLAPQNETELYTRVKGTLGYLDPEFIQLGQLTEKSDVYSFGVVLLELLTGQRVLHFDRPKSGWCLVNYFRSSFSRGRLEEALDERIVSEGNEKQMRAVSEIAVQCVRVKAEERPGMKEVAIELGGMLMEGKSASRVKHESSLEEREQQLMSYISAGDTSSTGDHTVSVPLYESR